MGLLNRVKGDVMTMLAGMNEELDDEDAKEELTRCFSNVPTNLGNREVERDETKTRLECQTVCC